MRSVPAAFVGLKLGLPAPPAWAGRAGEGQANPATTAAHIATRHTLQPARSVAAVTLLPATLLTAEEQAKPTYQTALSAVLVMALLTISTLLLHHVRSR